MGVPRFQECQLSQSRKSDPKAVAEQRILENGCYSLERTKSGGTVQIILFRSHFSVNFAPSKMGKGIM